MPRLDYRALRALIPIRAVLAQLHYVPLQIHGDQWRGPCPLHRSRDTSDCFSVQVHKHVLGWDAPPKVMRAYQVRHRTPEQQTLLDRWRREKAAQQAAQQEAEQALRRLVGGIGTPGDQALANRWSNDRKTGSVSPPISRLSLRGVPDAGLVHLKGLTRLHLLQLAGTQVTDAGHGLAENLVGQRLLGQFDDRLANLFRQWRHSVRVLTIRTIADTTYDKNGVICQGWAHLP